MVRIFLVSTLLLSGCSLSQWSLESIHSWSDRKLCEFHSYFSQHASVHAYSGEEIARRQSIGTMTLNNDECAQAGQKQLDAQQSYNHAYWMSQGLDHTRL
ncbi:hypothetical protein KUV89_00895 [Marinobacter hydrocarbonoclasticus]|nr:hypothetical protein [Marinobacter nauticus]